MTRALAGLLAAGAVLGWALPAAYREGPPPAHTGGFGEPLCSQCHFGAPVNDTAGSLTIDAPARFRAGEEYRIGVRLTRPGMAAAGFQLAIRFADGDRAGRQAGTLEAVDPGTAVTTDTTTGILYAHQTEAGASLGANGEAAWELRWIAPPTRGDVVVHAAANAANDDASEFGDFIYATKLRIAGHDKVAAVQVRRAARGRTAHDRPPVRPYAARVDDPGSSGHLWVFDQESPLPRLRR